MQTQAIIFPLKTVTTKEQWFYHFIRIDFTKASLKDHVVRMVNRVLHSLLVFRPTKELYWIKQQERKRERPFSTKKLQVQLIDHILHYSSPPID